LELPIGYTEESSRRCVFIVETFSPGYQGLAWAILLRAIEDGCNANWLMWICHFYGIDVDDKLFDRHPYSRVQRDMKTYHRRHRNRQSPDLMAMDCGQRRKLTLSWEDALCFHIREQVASFPCQW